MSIITEDSNSDQQADCKGNDSEHPLEAAGVMFVPFWSVH